MNFLKTYINRNNKKVSPSSKNSSFAGSSYSAQNGSHDLFAPPGEYSSKESPHWGQRNPRHVAKSSPLPMGSGTPSRKGLVGSAKVIQTLGADSLEEAMDILTIMQRPNPSGLATDSFRSECVEENDQIEHPSGENRSPRPQIFAMRTHHSSAVSEFYEPGYPLTGHLISHINFPDYSVDPPRCSWDGFLSAHYMSRQQEQFSSNDISELRNAKSTPRRHSVSTLDSPFAVGSNSTDHRSMYDSPQLSPHMPIRSMYDSPQLSPHMPIRSMYDSPQVSPHMPIAHPLPTPPSSPSKSGRKILPKKLPLPPPMRPAERDFERSQRMSPWKTHPSCQSSVSPQQCPKNWTKGKVLGKGSFGTVYEALNHDDGSFFAVKISEAETAAPELRQEIDVLKRLNHPNIVRYLGSSLDEGHLCIFLELVGMGSLRRVLDKYKHFEENMIRTYTRQILWGLEYLHQQNTVHRDLKCANILVDPYGQVKLADFGVAKQMSQSLANSCKGTPLYMAPEMMKDSTENRKYGLQVDIWSLGCTIIEMADGKAPWSDLEGFSFFFKLNRGELPPIPDHLSLEAKDFLGRCLKVKPQERANVSELLQHPFVANAPAFVPPLSPHMSSQRQYL